MTGRVKLAIITGAHGIRGQVKLKPLTDDLAAHLPVTDESGKPVALTLHGESKGTLLASLPGVNDRTTAEKLRGQSFYGELRMGDKKTNEFYVSELVGLTARQDGKQVGKIAAIYNFGAGDILEIALDKGGSEMLPFKGEFVGEVDITKGQVEIFLPDYIEDKEK